jgi:hypothetical protein
MKTRRILVLALLWLGSAGCAEVGPDIGEAVELDTDTGACVLEDSDPATDVRWAEVKGEIFAKRCGCHMTPSGFGATVGGLLLADHASALKGGRHQNAGRRTRRRWPSPPATPAAATSWARPAPRRPSARACP